ncbi:MAG TPA: amino acid adenylation domain-containing protein [Polyangiaceae bacterium]|nr:amino acid adenylation domain-containing protein [Polyangiaceae bacterium]
MAGSLERFLTIAKQHADRPAIVEQSKRGTTTLLYGELRARAERLGSLLMERGVGPEQIVALDLPKSADLVMAALACWYAGAAFLPLDWSLPSARRAAYLRQANVSLAITTEAESRVPEGVPCLVAETRLATRTLPAAQFDAERLAYVISTSGSSGIPKAVAVSHRGLLPLLEAQIRAFDLEPGDCSSWLLSPAFDASISDWGTALLSGATLYIDPRLPGDGPRAIQEAISRDKISYIDLPPALLPHLPVGPYPSLKTIVIGGEVAEVAAVRRWSERVRLINVYGPTETTICTSYRVADATWEKPLLGQPIDRSLVQYAVRDPEGRRCAPDTPGELYISGACLARGYLAQPELTQTRFVEIEDARAFRSGDRVVQRSDGEFEFLGRIDRQIKVRGALVAPEEIEAELLSIPGVRRAAVLEVGERKRITAFLEGERTADSELRCQLAARLPHYMVPERFEWLDVMPLTSSGKPHLVELQEPRGSRVTATSPPEEEHRGLKERIAAWYARVLGTDVEPEDDFFALGGNSLRALELIALAALDGVELTPDLLFKSPRVVTLAQALTSRDSSNGKSCHELTTRLHTEGLLSRPDSWIGSEEKQRARFASEDPDSVLVTGATGFLGSRLILELLEQTKSQIWCLVRAPDPVTAETRVLDAIASHGRGAVDARRLRCVVGDLSEPTLARADSDRRGLVDDIHTIYHCGAAVSLMADCNALWETNVRGTDRVLRLCERGRPKSLHYASTLSVFVSARSSQVSARHEYLESDCLEQTLEVFGGYAQTKWAAEVLVRTRANPRSSTFIHRLGLLTGDSRTGRGAERDWLALVLRGLTKLGIYPQSYDAGLAVDITPVDYVTRALVHLARQATRPGHVQTTHLAGPRAVGFGELVSALQGAGVHLEPVEPNIWATRLSEALESSAEPELASAFLALRRVSAGERAQHALDLFQATRCRFDDRETRTLLSPVGIECPPATPALLREYARHTSSTERAS